MGKIIFVDDEQFRICDNGGTPQQRNSLREPDMCAWRLLACGRRTWQNSAWQRDWKDYLITPRDAAHQAHACQMAAHRFTPF